MKAPPCVQFLHKTTGTSTDFTDVSESTCGSSMDGIILQDWDASGGLEQVSKFNSSNQNMHV